MSLSVIYLVLVLIWIGIAIYLKLYRTNIVGLLILCIPIAIFAFATYFQNDDLVSNHTLNNDDDFLTIGIILLLPLLAYFDKDYEGDKARFMSMIIISLFLFLLSVIPMWVPSRFAKYTKILRSSIQTIAITLLLYVIFLYYTHRSAKLDRGISYASLSPLFACP
jgi:hypothetical protein